MSVQKTEILYSSDQRDDTIRSYMRPLQNPGDLATYLCRKFSVDGYETQSIQVSKSEAVAQVRKIGALRAFFGLRQSVTARISVEKSGTLIEVGKAAWVDKVFGMAIGWMIVAIPLITSIFGIYHQHLARKKMWLLIEHYMEQK